MHKSIKPPALKPGDTIGIISPSWGGAGLFPHRVELGRRALENMGFHVNLGKHALNQHGYVSDTPENRAADIHAMFTDPQVNAIVSTIGGDHACQLLPLLDFDLIRDHPKIFMGFSDITVLNIAIWQQTGLVTFNGPMLLTDFAEYPRMFDYTRENMINMLCEPQPTGKIEPSAQWTEEFLDWGVKADLQRPRTMQPSIGWKWLKPGTARGILIGGCLESLEHLHSTRYWPYWKDAIFFFETSEEAPPPARVDSILSDYENMDILQQLRGMLVGRPMRYSEQQKEDLYRVLLERTEKYSFPILAEMDFGHTSPQFTIPIGCEARLDSQQEHFEISEAAVA
jgi:muramoyltetrapeptide carboxypeptidase LdcA involved in peptidoglycan recycling